MAVITKTHALRVIRRAYGPEHADAVAGQLPERIDMTNPADTALLYRLGLTPDRLASALGGEL
ncbi:hypothetical protein BJ973_001008 [Actinoplanes tereljensis]|uniref:Uncharacterized protein n=1 Tax=Paractinoplanes tereljensis TaxID=571912 RepID=A0A919NZ96_9ACTN|nr:hypothetical protein [Actinoplanes tereljensis]GIF26564.1 hypothetical protein Ate02nite_92940 [Actinoplanes tereljensis]